MRERILILEDDPDMRRSLVDALEDEGYQVDAVGQGLEAVQKAQEEPFDLIVADVRMPGMDGLQALEQVREKQPAIRSMVVSGYSSEADSLRALRLGVGIYLRKPFHLEVFLEAVERTLAQRRQEKAVQAQQRSMRRTALWALETIAGPLEGTLGRGRLALRLATHRGMDEESAEEVQITALVALLQREGKVDVEPLVECLPPLARQWLDMLDERWDGGGQPDGLAGEEIPLGARVASLIVHNGSAGAYDPQLEAQLEELSRPGQGEQKSPTATGLTRRHRNLLALAHTLEQSQDAGAQRAYEEILAPAVVSRESVQALLGLARLDKQRSPERVRQACHVARQVCPTVYGNACLESGLLLGESGLSYLEEAQRLFSQLNLSSLSLKAELALATRSHSDPRAALERFLESPSQYELGELAWWLLRPLLERNDPALDRAIARLARQAPAELLSQLPQLSLAQKLVLARVVRWESPIVAALEADDSEMVRRAVKTAREQGVESRKGDPVLRLLTLGPLSIYRNDELIEEKAWRNRKIPFLLAFLASQRQHPSSEDAILEHFWPQDAARGRNSLYAALSTARRLVSEDLIKRTPQGYLLNPEVPHWQDLDEFLKACQEGAQQEQAGSLDNAAERWRKAVELYRAPYLEGCYMDWAILLRDKAERSALDALEKLAGVTLRHNKPVETLEHAYRLIEIDPCYQKGYLLLMQANLALGRPEASIRLYEKCCKVLRRELAMEPTTALMEAHQRALLAV